MAYHNAWGDKGTYAEVFAATVDRMDTDDLVDELCYFISEDDLLRWILKTVPEEFKRDYAPVIHSATEYWVECRLYEEDDEDDQAPGHRAKCTKNIVDFCLIFQLDFYLKLWYTKCRN